MDARFEEAAALESEGAFLVAEGELARAAECFTRMRDLLAERALAMPDDPLAMRHVASAIRRIALARSGMEEHEAGRRLAEDAYEICERRCKADPADSEPERELNLCCDLLGHVLTRMGRAENALRYLEQGVELARWLASLPFGDEGRRSHDLAGSLELLAWTLQDLGRPEDALRAQREQVSLARRLVEMDTDHRPWLRFLASSLSSMGGVLRELGHAEEARDVLEDALAQYDQAFRGVVPGIGDLNQRAVAYRRVGMVCALTGDHAAAERHLASAVDLGRAVVKASPEVRDYQRALESALTELALVLQRDGKERAARSAAREAADLKVRLRRQ